MKVILTLITLSIIFEFQAQQDQLTTQFWNNYAHINPATSGLEYKHSAAVLYRNQWDKVNGAPKMLTANYNTLIKGHHGVGVNYMYEQIAFNSRNDVNLNYNYQFILGEHKGIQQKLSIGVAVGFIHLKTDPDWYLQSSQVPVESAAYTAYGSNFNAGLAYKGSNLFAGFGVTHLTETPLRYGIFTFNTRRHYYLMGGYSFQLGKSKNFELKPQILLRTDAVKLSGDLNLLASYSIKQKQTVWLGATFRSQDAVAIMVGWDINQRYRIGYSYDHTINQLSSISRGSHEIVLGLLIK